MSSTPTVNTLINSSNCTVLGNSSTGNALSVQQVGAGNVFVTSNASGRVALFVSATSNVGVGTTNPTAPFHIRGAGQPTATAFNTTGNLGGSIVLQDSDTQAFNGGAVVFGASQGYFAAIKGSLQDGTTNTKGDLYFATRNAVADASLATRMTITAGGNVGIGTASPQAPLHVIGDVLTGTTGGYYYGSLAIQNDGNANYGSIIGKGIQWDGTNYKIQTDGVNTRCSAIQMSWDQGFRFITTAAAGGSVATLTPAQLNSNVKAVITNGGSVGIGTASPVTTFHVGSATGFYGGTSGGAAVITSATAVAPLIAGQASTTSAGNMYVGSSATYARNTGGGIIMGGRGYDFGAGNNFMPFARISGVQRADGDAYDGDFVVETMGGGSGNGRLYERMRIASTGNVGIGTASPNNTIDLNAVTSNGCAIGFTYTGKTVHEEMRAMSRVMAKWRSHLANATIAEREREDRERKRGFFR